jgi:hypothetical protein
VSQDCRKLRWAWSLKISMGYAALTATMDTAISLFTLESDPMGSQESRAHGRSTREGAILRGVESSPPPDGLKDEERALALTSERRWRKAHELAARAPSMDVGDLYHALCSLELSPTERLRRGLARGRLRAYAR